MILTKDNTDEQICAFLMQKKFASMRFFDPKTSKVFEASPCERCGTMTAHANELTIEAVSDSLNRTLQEYYSVIDFVECLGYDDDGEEICEKCED